MPLATIALAFGAAAPVVAILALVLVVLPLLATWGDSIVHRFRRQSGTARRWIERATPPAAAAPVRFVGNVVMSVLRSLPVVALTGALLGLWYGLDNLNAAQGLLDAVLRGIGLLAASILVVPGTRWLPPLSHRSRGRGRSVPVRDTKWAARAERCRALDPRGGVGGRRTLAHPRGVATAPLTDSWDNGPLQGLTHVPGIGREGWLRSRFPRGWTS